LAIAEIPEATAAGRVSLWLNSLAGSVRAAGSLFELPTLGYPQDLSRDPPFTPCVRGDRVEIFLFRAQLVNAPPAGALHPRAREAGFFGATLR